MKAYKITFANMQGKKSGVSEGYKPSWYKLLLAKVFGIQVAYHCEYYHPMGYYYKGILYVTHDDPCIQHHND